MNNVIKIALGLICILAAFALLFFAPVIWHNYPIWFGIKLDSEEASFSVVMFFVCVFLALILLGILLFNPAD